MRLVRLAPDPLKLLAVTTPLTFILSVSISAVPIPLIVTDPVEPLTVILSPAVRLVTGVDNVDPSPIAVYNSVKLELILIAPDNILSPVPSFGIEPVLIPSLAITPTYSPV